jgi:serine/threonine protein kinase
VADLPDQGPSDDVVDSRQGKFAEPPAPTPGEPFTGQRLGDYELLEAIGAGGFSLVWRARHRSTGEIVAVKLPRVPEFVAHLTREAFISSRFQDPGVAGILEVRLDHEPPYLVSPYIPGQDLPLPSEVPPPQDIVLALVQFRKIAEVVARLHDAGFVHGDLKPGNIRIDLQGGCHLLDLGLARHQVSVRQASTLRASIVSVTGRKIAGTLEFMAPEVMSGAAPDRSADVYALGVLLHAMVCGRPPAFGVSPEALNPFLPPGTTALLREMLDLDPERRHSTAGSILPHLDDLIGAERRCLRRRNGHARRRVFRERMRTLARGLKVLSLTAVAVGFGLYGLPFARVVLADPHPGMAIVGVLLVVYLGIMALLLGMTTINAWIMGIPEQTYKNRRGHPWWSFMMQ